MGSSEKRVTRSHLKKQKRKKIENKETVTCSKLRLQVQRVWTEVGSSLSSLQTPHRFSWRFP